LIVDERIRTRTNKLRIRIQEVQTHTVRNLLIRIRNTAVGMTSKRFFNKTEAIMDAVAMKKMNNLLNFSRKFRLKGLSHEIDFKNFDKNLQNLA
jgi:hypothetical protein